MEAEVVHVEFEAAVAMQPDELLHLIDVAGLPERRHPHDLVLALVDLEAEKGGKGAVEQPQRMGKADFLEQVDLCPLSNPETGRGPFANAIDRKDRRFVKWRAQEGAGRVGKMVLAEEDFPPGDTKLVLDQVPDPEFVAEPGQHRFAKDAQRAGKGLHAGEQQALELEERLFEEDHVIEVGRLDSGAAQTKVDGVLGKAIVVLFARESLLFGSGDQLAVTQQSGGRVVEIAGNAKNQQLKFAAIDRSRQ